MNLLSLTRRASTACRSTTYPSRQLNWIVITLTMTEGFDVVVSILSPSKVKTQSKYELMLKHYSKENTQVKNKNKTCKRSRSWGAITVCRPSRARLQLALARSIRRGHASRAAPIPHLLFSLSLSETIHSGKNNFVLFSIFSNSQRRGDGEPWGG
jgi:hypothetical protein